MSDNPIEIPLRFFRFLKDEKYTQAWDLLTNYSQKILGESLLKSFKAAGYQNVVLREFFKNDQLPVEFWVQFSQYIKPNDWLQLTYTTLASAKEKAVIETSPVRILLSVYKEDGQWKFGYMESFAPQS